MSTVVDTDVGLERQLHDSWKSDGGIIGWISNTSHTTIGKRYIVTALVFFVLAGIEAALMRIQLSRPDNHFLNPDLYNQMFTVHGTSMMFLFAVPMMEGIGIYLVPLMVGTRNVAFPRLNAYGYFVYLFGGILLYIAFFSNMGPDAGWFSYPPLSGPQYSPGKRVDTWAQMITFTEISGLVVAVELIVTVFKQRAVGMTLNRIPLFVWAMLVTSFMILFAMPGVIVDSLFLALDRLIATHFFNPSEGGDVLLYQHLFWFFGHPEVYIIFLPAMGMVSTIITAFTRKPVFGYLPLVLSLVSTGFIGFGLWVHHMFATGLPQLGESFFTAASMMITIPSGVQIFCWIASLWRSRPEFKSPLMFVIGFFLLFVMGGLTGVMVASVPFDLQAHDTYFVVAHFHYVLIGGAVFPLFGAFYFWFPKLTGRMLSERMGKWNFWLFFLGFNLTFFPMHILGLKGMARRIYTYPAEMGWGDLNMLASVGTVIIAASLLIFVFNVMVSLRSGAIAGDNPWNAEGLEWGTSSPPPVYNFLHLPVVEGRSALWDRSGDEPVISGIRSDRREILITTLMDAAPDHRFVLPGPSIWPLGVALATAIAFIYGMFSPWAGPLAFVAAGISLTGWFWPKKDEEHPEEPE